LAIAHRIVTDHAGTIDVDSRPGRTVFRVTLPVGGALGRTMPTETSGET
jgi:nitrogen-specific signal transduction histidine kinase